MALCFSTNRLGSDFFGLVLPFPLAFWHYKKVYDQHHFLTSSFGASWCCARQIHQKPPRRGSSDVVLCVYRLSFVYTLEPHLADWRHRWNDDSMCILRGVLLSGFALTVCYPGRSCPCRRCFSFLLNCWPTAAYSLLDRWMALRRKSLYMEHALRAARRTHRLQLDLVILYRSLNLLRAIDLPVCC